jgi:hypothetical protein
MAGIDNNKNRLSPLKRIYSGRISKPVLDRNEIHRYRETSQIVSVKLEQALA